MSTSAEQTSLEDLFHRALDASSKVINMPSIEDETQAIISSILQDLRTVAFRINLLGLFSPNEAFDEVSIRNMPYMLVQYVVGEVQLRVKSIEPEDRMDIINGAKIAFNFFVRLLDDYAVIPTEDKKLYATKLPADAWKRRDSQIAQYKAKKALKANVDNLRSRRKRPSTSSSSPNDFDLISDLLPSANVADDEDEDEVRELLRTVLKLFWVQALDHLSSIDREDEMLRNAPPRRDNPQSSEPSKKGLDDDSWRLDMPLSGGRLIDEKGRPLQPFIILPSASADERARLKSEVFRPDHRLPTMTIDELLEIERQQGKFVTGGGEASFNAPTSKELLQEASELDGTLGGDEKSEQKRKEEEEWALYTEANPKGMGTFSKGREYFPKHGERVSNTIQVIVAMSGGVDSSVTAALLAQSPLSYDISAVFMRNWDTRDETGEDKIARCEWKQDWEDVQAVSRKLGISCTMIDLSRQYWNSVFEPSLDVWKDGRTPNPDVMCNREIKFGALLDHPKLINAWLATGHYARVDLFGDSRSELHPRLLRGIDETKDQSYWLSSVPSHKFRKAIFPLGSLTKSQVREIAKKFGLSTASKRESMGICFVGKKRSFSTFLDAYLPSKPGDIVTPAGTLLARHSGLWNFTIGQNARIPGLPKRVFVCAKNKERNEIVVVDDPEHPLLKRTSVAVEDFHWIWEAHPPIQALEIDGMQVTVKFRSVMQPAHAHIFMSTRESGRIKFHEPQQGVAAGQIAAIYQGDWCLGGGTIVEE